MTSITDVYAVAHIDDAVKKRLIELGINPGFMGIFGCYFLPSAAWGDACAENIGNHLPPCESGPALTISIEEDINRGWLLFAGPFVLSDQPSAALDLVTRMIREIAGSCEWWPVSKAKWVNEDHSYTNLSWQNACPGLDDYRWESDQMCEELLSKTPEPARAAFASKLALYRNLGPYCITFGLNGYEGYIAFTYFSKSLMSYGGLIVIDSYFQDRQPLILQETHNTIVESYSLADIRCRRVPQRAPIPPKDKCLFPDTAQ